MSVDIPQDNKGGITIYEDGLQLTFNRNSDVISELSLVEETNLEDPVIKEGILKNIRAKKIQKVWKVADYNKMFNYVVKTINQNDGTTIALMSGSELIARTELRYDYYEQSRLDYFKPHLNKRFTDRFPNFEHAPQEYVSFDVKNESFILPQEEELFYKDLFLMALHDAAKKGALLTINNSDLERKDMINKVISSVIPQDEDTIFAFEQDVNKTENALAYVIDPQRLFNL